MKKSRFSEAQMIGVLREQEAGTATEDVCCRHGISQQTFYLYGLLPFRKRFAGWA